MGRHGDRSGGGAECPLRSVLAPPALSLPRSFSSMSDITGKGPGTLGRARLGTHLRPMLPMLPLACVLSLRLCCPLARQGGSAQEVPGELIPTSHPEPIVVLSPGPSCALWSYSVPARPPPSSRKLKGHPGRPRPSPEPCESSVFPGPPTFQGLWALSHPWARGAQPLLMYPALPHGSAGAPEPHPSSPGSVTLKPWSPGLSSSSSSDSVWPLGKPDGLLARGCGLDLFSRYHSRLGQGGAGGLVRIPGEG